MTPLPIDPFLPRIVETLRHHRALVLVAEPGAGKTTRVPPAILRAGVLDEEHPNLVMLQPRRVAARATAQRIAEENGWQLGREVGFHVRFERRIGDATRLRVLTEGILGRQLIDDPTLSGIGCVVLDEFHERSVHGDLSLALLREVCDSLRGELRIVVMSATLDAEPVSRFLHGAPIVRVPGTVFPVEIEHLAAGASTIPERAADAVRDVVARDDAGDILVFLPGEAEIRRTIELLEPLSHARGLDLLPLHGTLPLEQQLRALRPSERRKVVVATNIAETSLTIDGVRTVIDSGLARVPLFDPQRGLDRLELLPISRASAAQRSGRAGRTAPGRCIRLWTSKEDAARPAFDEPEIARIDLAPVVLLLHAWGVANVRGFAFFEPPPPERLDAAERLLQLLGALENGRLTERGRLLQRLPLHPRLASLLLQARSWGVERAGAEVAALLAERDILLPQREPRDGIGSMQASGDSDVLVRLDALQRARSARFAAALRDEGIDPHAARQATLAAAELLRVARQIDVPRSSPGDVDPLLLLPLLAYPDRLCRRRDAGGTTATMVGGVGVKLAAESVVKRAELFVALDAREDARSSRRESLVRIASRVELPWIERLLPTSLRRESVLRYDETADRVVSSRRLLLADLVLRDDPTGRIDSDEASRVLATALRDRAVELFARDEDASRLLARIELLRRHLPEHAFPRFDDATLSELLFDACRGARSLAEVRSRGSLASAIRARLVYPLDRLLDEHAPEVLRVPTGNRIRLDYAPGQPPTLKVRLQEMFGQQRTPTVAAGRVRVVLHLLGPNYRPVQITEDLESFWRNTYQQVRKDMRARYPKHAWPDDPTSAAPIAKGSPRRT